jgi:drug/metabolite transporter (DMT)-like permease
VSQTVFLLFPLVSAILYVFGAMFMKRAIQLGFDVWRTSFICNIVYAIMFSGLLVMGGTTHVDLLWQPAIVGALFIIGQSATVISLQSGDVSLATPVLGLKILMVAFFTALILHDGVALAHWIAAVLSVLGIALLSRSGAAHHTGVAKTVFCAAISALAFALFDVLVQKWSPHWGAGRFLPVMFGLSAVMSLAMIPFFKPADHISREGWRAVLAGGFLASLQSVFFVSAVAVYGKATSANVVYSTRGLWSVILVWYTGHLFKNTEHESGKAVFGTRLAGAVLMTVSVAIVFLTKDKAG